MGLTRTHVELATAFTGQARTDSHYKRLQRLFRKFELDYYVIARLVVALMDIPEPWVLSLDRTQWQRSQTTFNILTLGTVHQGVAFAVLWWMLDKKGNSNTDERIDLLKEFVTLFPEQQIAYLAAEREFLGHDWFGYLLKQAMIPFRIRIRESDCLGDGQRVLKASVVFQHLKPNQQQVLSKRRRLWGRWLYVSLRLEDNHLLLVATPNLPPTAIIDYAARWGIETLFGSFKTRGLCLESTHFTDPERSMQTFGVIDASLMLGISHRAMVARIQPTQNQKARTPSQELVPLRVRPSADNCPKLGAKNG